MEFFAGHQPTADELNTLVRGRVRVTLEGDQPLSHNSTTKIKFDTVGYDDSALWDEVAHRILIPPGMAGVYLVAAGVSYAGPPSGSSAVGRRSCDIQTNNGRLASTLAAPTSTLNCRYTASTLALLEVGDSLWTTGYQTQGVPLNVTGASTNVTFMSVARVQPW